MSGIYGIIDLNGNKIKEEYISYMKEAFSDCVIDQFYEVKEEHAYLGCALQHFTKEAMYEKLPYQNDNMLFTADVILDNRNELMEALNRNDSGNVVTDGEILYQTYIRQKENCLNKMIGAYVGVWYDKKKNEITIVDDAVGYRFVYYIFKNGVFYFSSLMKPLEQILGKVTINERWMADFIGQDNLNMFTEEEETPLKEISRIAPASILTITNKKL